MKQITFQKFIPNLSLNQIDVSEQNVRKLQLEAGLEELQASIGQINLIQPVIVLPKGGRYKLIVGQRRYLAFKALDKKTIPALVINPIDTTSQTIISFGENVHRRKLPYEDTIRVCDELYNEFTGSKSEKINKIARTLGISHSSVTKFLAHKLVPTEVQTLVTNGKISQDVAYRIASAYFPDTQKIVSIAKNAARMTKSERRRAVDYGAKKPNATVNEIMEYASNPPPTVEIIVQVEPETNELLKKMAQKKGSTVADLVKDAIDRMIEDEVR